jgi:predicted aspartyl protease
MGLVRTRALIGPSAEQLEDVEFLVDTEAMYTLLPPGLAREVGIIATHSTRVMAADSRLLDVLAGMACLRLLDREAAIPVGVMNVPVPLLGVTALEILGLKVNPVDGTVEQAWPFGPSAFQALGGLL